MPAEWYYEIDRNRVGPVDEEALKALIANGTLTRESLVWTSDFGPEWKPVGATTLSSGIAGPPPLPQTHVNNVYVWLLAFVPIIGGVVEKVIEQERVIPQTAIFISYFAVNSLLAFIDMSAIEKSGRDTKSRSYRSWFWLIPVYLFKRANALGQSKGYFWTWVVAILVSIGISGDAKNIIDGNTYWGSGLPGCDSNFTKKQTQEIFGNIPLMKMQGIIAVDVQNQREISGTSELKSCTATFVASNGRSFDGRYTIQKQGDQFYTNLNLDF